MTGTHSTPEPSPARVLFVGDDASSAQIAADVLRLAAGDRVVVTTAGTRPGEPGGRSDEMLVAMGLDPAEEQVLSSRALYTADRVVVLGAGLDVARLSGPTYEEWDLAPGDLVDRVEALGEDLTRPVATRRSPVRGRMAGLRGRLRRHHRRPR